jgi:DMSO/TMAO reductase YedYZ molybdopterin-dependent catalytic subunit
MRCEACPPRIASPKRETPVTLNLRKRDTLPPEVAARLPPGQVLTDKWPVLHYGSVPQIAPEAWKLRIWGEVEAEAELDWAAFGALPRSDRASDIHCVTRWSRLDNRWSGVAVTDVMSGVTLLPAATHVLLHAFGGWTTNLPLADFLLPDNLFATHHDGAPLTAEHGAPVRVVIPHLYFWKSAKWVRGVEVIAGDQPGFWERNGYHMRGDPWKRERYS